MNQLKCHTVSGGGGVRLHATETGNAAGKAILFIHGLSQCGMAWKKQMESDLADSFRLVALDIRGHGLSDKPRDAYGESRDWADDVHCVIKELKLDQPLLAGWSYGGAIISDYISCYGEDEIAGTNWIGAVCRLGETMVSAGFVGERFAAETPGLFSENVSESVATAQRLLQLGIPSGISEDEQYLLLGCNLVVPPHVRAGLLSRNLNHDAVVRKMKKPMLLSWGQEDAIIPPAMGEHIAALASHAKVSTYPGAGHWPFWEAPGRFNRELRDFRESI